MDRWAPSTRTLQLVNDRAYLAFRAVSRCAVLLARCGGGPAGSGMSLTFSCSRAHVPLLLSLAARGLAPPTIMVSAPTWPASRILSTRATASRRVSSRPGDADRMPLGSLLGSQIPLVAAVPAFLLLLAARGDVDLTVLPLCSKRLLAGSTPVFRVAGSSGCRLQSGASCCCLTWESPDVSSEVMRTGVERGCRRRLLFGWPAACCCRRSAVRFRISVQGC